MYLPGHRGMVANEYADAVAKTHAQRDVDEDITRKVDLEIMGGGPLNSVIN
jgi:hypothetical protein